MTTGAIQTRPAAILPCLKENVSRRTVTKQQLFLIAVAQIAIRILYVFSIAMAAYFLLPVSFQSLFLAPITAGAALVSSFFFLSKRTPSPAPLPIRTVFPPLIKQALPLVTSPSLPVREAAPKGIFRIGMNDAINSVIHLVECEPVSSQLLRKSMPLHSNFKAFEQFLAPYQPPKRLMRDFEASIQNEKRPIQIPIAFKEFLKLFAPTNEEAASFHEFRRTYNLLLVVLRPIRDFFVSYDRAIDGNNRIVDGNSQAVRLALSQINPSIDSSAETYLNAAQVYHSMLDLLPDSQKIHIEERTHFQMQRLPPIAAFPDGIQRRHIKCTRIPLEILNPPDLEKMFASACGRNLKIERRGKEWLGTDGRTHRYHPTQIEWRFLEAPPVLRFEIQRFNPPPGKIDQPIAVPNELQLPLVDGTVQKYRLAGCVIHQGEAKKGHYIAGRIVNGKYYSIDDHQVATVDRRVWEERMIPQAYLLCYLPEE